ncbi:MAG: Rieske 2Fe-2S domain-containing protein [Rhodobacteraceae bacterium]|nr:Rieske 2Fe-2S domain-containing protein [Paracoccaceae bacterium]
MDRTDLPDLTLSLQPADQASSLPPEFYTAPHLAEREIDVVFRGNWFGVGRADMVREPGDYVTFDVAGQSIILLRDTSGSLQAFANTCRHRGARLLDGQGRCKGIRCPFHSWFYGLDGRLVAAPHMDNAKGFEKHDNGLVAYRAAERLGFAFVCLSPEAPDLDACLGDFAQIHAQWPLKDLVTVRRQELEVNCNWKIFLEVFNEYYHLPFVHADSIDSLYDRPEPGDLVTGCFATQFGKTEGTGGLLEGDQDKALPDIPGLTGQAQSGARYTWVFPNMTFAANTDAMWCYEAYPLGPDRCKVVQSSCFPAETIRLSGFEDKLTAYLARMDAALAEDVEALINQQRGLSNPDARPGRFQPDLEPNVAAFAHWYSGLWG